MNDSFSLRLKNLRAESKISQSALGQMIGISQQTVAKWEKGLATPNPETVGKLAQIFDVSADFLLGISDRKSNESEDIKFALWGGDADEISDEMLEDVRRYAKFIHEQKKNPNF